MELIHKTISAIGRDIYLYYPGEDHRTPFKTNNITVLLDKVDEAACLEALDNWGLRQLAEQTETIISFPVPAEGGWNFHMDPNKADDVKLFPIMQDAVNKPHDNPIPTEGLTTPLHYMLYTWHPIHDCRYIIGVGGGASMALTLAAVSPDQTVAVLAVDGDLSDEALKNAKNSPVPVNLAHCGAKAIEYFKKANDVSVTTTFPGGDIYSSAINPLQTVTVMNDDAFIGRRLVLGVWEEVFSQVRRPKCGKYGTVDKKINVKDDPNFEYYIKDTRLNGDEHTWFVHVPTSVKADPHKKVPLVVYCHGGSDCPGEAAEMTQLHVLGERDGFITVYPWSCDTIFWDSDPDGDEKFVLDLINYMEANYPVDTTRVYIGGFSAGGAMAQIFSMTHPDRIAGLFHNEAHWPGLMTAGRDACYEMDYNTIPAMVRAFELKKSFDYRVPAFYIYGALDGAYPVIKGRNQQHQYDFWKTFNNIEVKPTATVDTPELNGVGVIGDVRERIDVPMHPGQYYDVQRFFSMDEKPMNLYNFSILHDKDHDIGPMDVQLGWNFVKQFRRNSDGTLSLIEE